MKNIIIPHGFQNHYTVGFLNGLVKNQIPLTVLKAENEFPELNPSINTINIKVNSAPSRTKIKKLTDHAAYHIRLLIHIIKKPKSTVHITGTFRYRFIESIFELFLIRILSKNLILTVHNLLPHDQHTRINHTINWICYRIPHHLIVHTNRMKQELISQFNINSRHITIMQHGLNSVINESKYSQEECRSSLSLPDNKCVLLIFGTVSPYKGIDTMLECFELLDTSYYLIIAGRAENETYEQSLIKKISKNMNKKNILRINRFIDDKEVPCLFKASNVMIMPYKHIDQSGMIFLAMKLGLPTIAFNVGSLENYITPLNGLIINQKDARGLMESIHAFKKTMDNYSAAAIIKKAMEFEWDRVTKPVLKLYDRM